MSTDDTFIDLTRRQEPLSLSDISRALGLRSRTAAQRWHKPQKQAAATPDWEPPKPALHVVAEAIGVELDAEVLESPRPKYPPEVVLALGKALGYLDSRGRPIEGMAHKGRGRWLPAQPTIDPATRRKRIYPNHLAARLGVRHETIELTLYRGNLARSDGTDEIGRIFWWSDNANKILKERNIAERFLDDMGHLSHATGVTAASATRRGSRAYNADASAVHHLPGTSTVAAAIVDGIGNSSEIAQTAVVLAETAARVGARRTPTIGILAAAELVSPPHTPVLAPDAEAADGVAVLAVAEPGQPTAIAWTGDARAYGWDGQRLQQLTTDHTIGEYLRLNGDGGPIEALAAAHDNWLRTSLGQSTVATVHAGETTAPLVILTSDGVHDQVAPTAMETLVRMHHEDPQDLADALVQAARPTEDGYCDDATAVVLTT